MLCVPLDDHLQEAVLSMQRMGSGDQTQVISLGSKWTIESSYRLLKQTHMPWCVLPKVPLLWWWKVKTTYPRNPAGNLISFSLPSELLLVHLHFSFLFLAQQVCFSPRNFIFVFPTKDASPEMPTQLPSSALLGLCCLLGYPGAFANQPGLSCNPHQSQTPFSYRTRPFD